MLTPHDWLNLLCSWLRKRGVKLRPALVIDEKQVKANAKDPRAFCRVELGDKKKNIYCAVALVALPPEAIVGILLHEITHMLIVEDGGDPELADDEYVLDHFPQAGYHYATIEYATVEMTPKFSGRVRTAKNIEVVSSNFIKTLKKEKP